jgi:hypothetical protein
MPASEAPNSSILPHRGFEGGGGFVRRIVCTLIEAPAQVGPLVRHASPVTLVKKDGTVLKTDIPAAVTPGQITTFVTEFPIEIEAEWHGRRLRCV